MSFVRVHEDQVARCAWVTDDQIYIDYHDQEWGTGGRNQQQLFEAICLEGFQAGLSWLTILKRREGFREAFNHFDIEKVACLQASDVERLMQNPGIIRNRAKIQSTINNANVVLDQGLDLTELLWSFAPEVVDTSEQEFQWRATTKESDAMSKALKKLGFSFVGSTTMHALMQSSGMVNDHAPGCFRRT